MRRSWLKSQHRYGSKKAGSPRTQPGRVSKVSALELVCWSWLSVRLACFLADYQKVFAPNHPWPRSEHGDVCQLSRLSVMCETLRLWWPTSAEVNLAGLANRTNHAGNPQASRIDASRLERCAQPEHGGGLISSSSLCLPPSWRTRKLTQAVG